MRIIKNVALAAPLLGASLLALGTAQAQTDFDRQITFGDSLSDGGFFSAFAPAGAGSFTTNPDPVWVEIIADDFGLDLDPSAAGGLNFAIGGARVGVTSGLALAIDEQIDLFLGNGGTFGESDLVTIQGGGNDIFALGRGDATLADVAQAGVDLATAVSRLNDLGAGTVLVANVQTLSLFNDPFEAALAAQAPNALFLDVDQLYAEIAADPLSFGFTNLTDPACGAVSSLNCLPSDLVEPDANLTYILADDVHPAGRAQAVQASMAVAALRAPTQVGQLAFVGEGHLSSAQSQVTGNLLTAKEAGSRRVFANAGGGRFELDGSASRIGAEEDSYGVTLGGDVQLTDVIGVGAALAYRSGEGDFDSGAGGFDTESLIGTAYARIHTGKLRVGASFSHGSFDLDDVSRNITLGLESRTEQGSTDGTLTGSRVELGYAAYDNGWRVSPIVGLTHTKIDIDGYTEDGGRSTALTYSDFDYSATRGFVGLELICTDPTVISPFVRVAYHSELGDEDNRSITVTPDEAPISWTTDAYSPSSEFTEVTAGVSMPVMGAATLGLVGNAEFGRDDIDRYDASVRFEMPF